jgi:hypothetical protein
MAWLLFAVEVLLEQEVDQLSSFDHICQRPVTEDDEKAHIPGLLMGWDNPIPSHPMGHFWKTVCPMGWDGMTFRSHGISTYFILEKDDYIKISRLIIGRNN